MTCYLIFDNREVLDPQALARYAEHAAPLVARHGGEYLVAGAEPLVFEGQPDWTSLVVIAFPDEQRAHDWYDDPDYAPWKQLRHENVRNDAVLVRGVDEAGRGTDAPADGRQAESGAARQDGATS